ncbi:methyl-accepting chemotaxis protein [Aliiroseovarius sp.]|uniref:methyl-accepting chemotaxis protein n=1 Tax=Aliiroseovarius sp. TaxID=1872442 RepID=UPI003BAD610F
MALSRTRKKTVKADLRGLLLLAAMLFVVLGAAIVGKFVLDRRTAAEMAGNQYLLQSVSRIEALFLQVRRAEKDFLLRKDHKYLTRHADIQIGLEREIAALLTALEQRGLTDQVATAEQLNQAFTTYGVNFAQLAELNVALGLTADEGREGELRAAVHAIETILKELDQPEMQVKMLMMRRHEKDFIMRVQEKYVDRLGKRVEEFKAFPARYYPSEAKFDEVMRLLDAYHQSFQHYAQATFTERDTRQAVSASFADAEPVFETLRSNILKAISEHEVQATRTQTAAALLAGLAGLAVVALFLARIRLISHRISTPLSQTADVIKELAAGNLDKDPPQSPYDEISAIARACVTFRETIQDNQNRDAEARKRDEADRAAREAEEQRARAEQHARLEEEERKRKRDQDIAREINAALTACAAGNFSHRLDTSDKDGILAEVCEGVNEICRVTNRGLDEVQRALVELSAGNTAYRMEGAFGGVFDTIRENVNRTAESLDDVISRIAESSSSIGGATEEIADAAMDLARRTENNAATLEQTASAIDELSSSVRTASDTVNGVNETITRIRQDAESNAEVVDRTVAAMDAIRTSSSEIRKIVGLIDDIAFQTNLLALNAGVEAARAGESGRGFAVVASEVRELAARSAAAAKEVGSFVDDSSKQVEDGAELVTRTGEALKSIVAGVAEMADSFAEIASSTNQQSVTISEINNATNQLDQSTQQNAAMFEEATASTQVLKSETAALAEVIEAFHNGHGDVESEQQTDGSQSAA